MRSLLEQANFESVAAVLPGRADVDDHPCVTVLEEREDRRDWEGEGRSPALGRLAPLGGQRNHAPMELKRGNKVG